MPRKPNSATSPKKAPKKTAAKSKSKNGEHPAYQEMILEAVNDLHERTGSSHSAILKYISTKYQIPPEKAKTHMRLALKKMVDKDVLLRVKASFKLADGTKNRLKKEQQEEKKRQKGKDKKTKDLEKKKADDKKQKEKEKEKKQKEKEKEKKQKEKEKKQKEKEKMEKAKKESPKKRKAEEVSRSPRKTTRDSTRVTRSSSPQKKKAGTKAPSTKRTKSKWLV